jgi:hypothetical protein
LRCFIQRRLRCPVNFCASRKFRGKSSSRLSVLRSFCFLKLTTFWQIKILFFSCFFRLWWILHDDIGFVTIKCDEKQCTWIMHIFLNFTLLFALKNSGIFFRRSSRSFLWRRLPSWLNYLDKVLKEIRIAGETSRGSK